MKDSLSYSRRNKRNGMANMASSHDLANMSRIDRFYVSDNFCDKGGKHGIMPGTMLSDHSPVILTIKSESKTMQIQMRVPEALLMDSQYSGEVERIWINQMEQAGNILEKVTQALEHISSFFKEQAKLSYEVYVTRERNIRRAVVSLQRLQERHPESRWVAEHLAQAKQTVTEIESKRGEFNFHYQKSRWSKTGDRCTKEFFDKVRPRKLNSGIRQLRKEDGTITEDPGEMRTIATKYFSQLLTAEETTVEILNYRQKVWEQISPRVSLEMRIELGLPLSTEELTEAFDRLPKHNCLGEDGFTPTFILNNWHLWKDSICMAFNEILASGHMPSTMGGGLIFLIPKGDQASDDICKWRPITLLNTMYKILAKAISLRLQPLLPQLIHSSQTGFIKERSILDNIFTFWESMAMATKTNQNLAILLLDFEKAYDRVDWGFLEGTLSRFGFADEWIRGVSALYSCASSKVLLAGGKGASFKLSRSVRQGCPLAPFLFLFFAEAMSIYLTATTTGLQGLSLPVTGEEILDAEFADDTGLVLKGTKSNLQQAEMAIDTFCKASGAKINWSKTVGFWVGKEAPPIWSPDANFHWIPRGASIRYLGCQVGIELAPEQQIAPLLLCIRRKLLSWSSARLSFAGRIVVVNSVLLATMWYILSCWVFSKPCINQIQRLVRNFLW